MGVTSKAFAEGSSFPEHEDPKLLRLYSMRFCPYAQRTRLLLRHLKIPHEEVNVNLRSKPDWFLARNPLGLVPVLELADKVVYESPICNEYLNDAHGSGLLPSDPYLKARTKILMELFGKVTDKYYGLMNRSKPQEEKEQACEELRKNLKRYEDALTSKFFGGEEPGLLDFHMWPWFERIPAVEKIANIGVFSAEQLPKLSAWTKEMLNLRAVREIFHSDQHHEEFILSYLTGGPVKYDLGLE